MRIFPSLITALLVICIVWALNRPWGDTLPMALGHFISPQHGFWQNAEPSHTDFNDELQLEGLKGRVSIYFDERLVPHVFAENDEDLYYAQGFLHAKFRLFQMDLQTRAAAGRASEFAGPKAISFDRLQRRLGMVFAAENALAEVEKDSVGKKVFDAYTRGVNAYIEGLQPREWPLEYKLLNVAPEKWSNLRSALLLKMMAKMLTGGSENDLGYTNARSIFSEEEFRRIYQVIPDSLRPIIPRGTRFASPGIVPVAPASADSQYFKRKQPIPFSQEFRPHPNNGSNSWAVAGSRTKSGAPILTNDPHLELSLPSIWYEIQLTDHSSTAYGVSLPGCPYVIIGFNEHIAWGVTNAARDVKDYYEIAFRDEEKGSYWYRGEWQPTQLRTEEIKVKGQSSVYDTVAYTVFGPVTYEKSFPDNVAGNRNLALRWTAHDPSNESMTFYKLNRAKNYKDYVEAIRLFDCPGQNFIFASKSGDIAIWQQGKFPARWSGQGLYTMPGKDDTYRWQGFIPQAENPHILNPARGFLQSANQRAVDGTYPYFIPGSYHTARGISIEQKLEKMKNITPDSLRRLLSDYDNVTARSVRPVFLANVRTNNLNSQAKKYLDIFRKWDLKASPDSEGQTIYHVWMGHLKKAIWSDEMDRTKPAAPAPDEQVLAEMLIRDSLSSFYDNISTPEKETLSDVMTSSFTTAAEELKALEAAEKLKWSQFKNPSIFHLLKDALPSFARTGLPVGGWGNTINAITQSHGPSWRMVVHLTDETEAYGVYPAGQSGNPGSKYYDDFVNTWVQGDLYRLWIMKKDESRNHRVKWTVTLNP